MVSLQIIVTGTLDITDIKNGSCILGLFDMWINQLCNHLCSLVPLTINNIIIEHYDPIVFADQYGINKNQLCKQINDDLIRLSDTFDKRISIHRYHCKKFDVKELLFPHLIIDMAHIFNYGPGKTIGWSNHNDSLYPDIQLASMPIRAIYIKWNDLVFATKELFIITEDGYVITYIHKLEDAGFIIDYVDDPVELLNDIVKKIKINLMSMWRKAKYSVKSSDAGGHFDDVIDSLNIIDNVLDKLFKNKQKEEILDVTTYLFFNDFNRKLEDPTYL